MGTAGSRQRASVPIMAFPWILHRYIFRELRNSFLLAALALTAVLSLGGGVLQMMKLGEVTPAQFVRLMVLVVPVAAALTLPIAALFATAVSYGRLSADNEFIACRSSGLNLHTLLLPTLILGMVPATVTFAFANYVIPRLVRNLNEFMTDDIGALIEQRLKARRGVILGGRYRIHADDFDFDPRNPSRISLHRVAFVEEDKGEWIRYGTARDVHLELEHDQRVFSASGRMRSLSFYDRRDGRFLDSQEQAIPRSEVAATLRPRIKFLTLGELLQYLRQPEEWSDAAGAVARLRNAADIAARRDGLMTQWRDARRISLDAEGWHIVMQPKSAALGADGVLDLADLSVEESRRGTSRTVRAARGVLELSQSEAGPVARLELFDVGSASPGKSKSAARVTLGPIPLSGDSSAAATSLDELLRTPTPLTSHEDPIAARRADARRILGETRRMIIGTIHERTAFSVSVFVLVLLAASLGIILRGSHVMTAFGISFLPMAFVLVTILAGRQMARNEPTHIVGLGLIWGGILFVAALNVYVLTRVLRR